MIDRDDNTTVLPRQLPGDGRPARQQAGKEVTHAR